MPLILLWLTNAIIATPVLLYVRYDFLVPAREHLLNFDWCADIKRLGITVLAHEHTAGFCKERYRVLQKENNKNYKNFFLLVLKTFFFLVFCKKIGFLVSVVFKIFAIENAK